jgi:hypothetical protein
MRCRIITAILALIAGCANQPTKEAFVQQAQQWVGQNADALVIRLGPPTSTFTLSDGNRVFQYSKAMDVTSGGGSYIVPTSSYIASGPLAGTWVHGQQAYTLPVTSSHLACDVRYLVDKSNKIIDWSSAGNYCVAVPAPR